MEIFGGKTLSLVFLKLELGAIEVVFSSTEKWKYLYKQ